MSRRKNLERAKAGLLFRGGRLVSTEEAHKYDGIRRMGYEPVVTEEASQEEQDSALISAYSCRCGKPAQIFIKDQDGDPLYFCADCAKDFAESRLKGTPGVIKSSGGETGGGIIVVGG